MNRLGRPAGTLRFSVAGLAVCAAVAAALPAKALESRRPLTKPDSIERVTPTSELTVKFRDELRVRSRGGTLASAAGLEAIADIATARGLTFEPLIHLPEDVLAQLEQRAAQRSGRAQPDLAGMFSVSGPVDALETAARELLARDEVEWVWFDELAPPPPCFDIPPVTPDYHAQGLQRHFDPLQGGLSVAYAWSHGARGQGVTIADCEYGWVPSEDLCDVINEPGQTIHPQVSSLGYDDHGTAVLGELAALDNAYGVKGLVPDVTTTFFSEWTVQQGLRRVTAITNAIASVDEGDVVLLEMQTTITGGSNYGPAELNPAVWTVVRAGTDAGVIVVGAAGNGNQNLDGSTYATYRSWGDSGAILVGAGSANNSHTKLSTSTYGARVNLQGWGQSVFTTGYGSFAAIGGDEQQTYIAGFSGTSSASPMVAASAVALQSLARAEFGCSLAPATMRQLLIDTGIPQGGTGGHIGPFPDLEAAIDTLLAGPGDCSYGCGNGAREALEICDGADTGFCPGLCAAECTCLPFGPGSAEGLRVRDVTPAGALTIQWTPACNAADHSLVWGPLEAVAGYGYSGQLCGLGTSGSSGPHSLGPGSSFFIVVGLGSAAEGSYGTDSSGAERPEHSGTVGCDAAQDLQQPCE